jgi:hypothetical protein
MGDDIQEARHLGLEPEFFHFHGPNPWDGKIRALI